MIKLKNVSKFYYSKGVVASGFSKVNLEFKIGEFVAITGESGSGKSTLLNVISGLDTYEEGEMYINGEETSHYTEKDFEDYRRKYIGNIFQNFNLVNSYTVYQNIELVLLLNGKKKKEIKDDVLDLIRKVDLYRFRNTKVSKLSGGQKQRVAIARALAKDTPIIIADEPTGNLDSKSASSIIKLLSEIAKDKLVIIVTHNYEQVEPYVTRKIKMHDGSVLEDKVIRKVNTKEEIKDNLTYHNITFLNKIRLGIRNAFNIVPKFLLVLLVYLFVTVSLISEYASFKHDEYLASKSGYNNIFQELSDKRIIIKKKDQTPFTNEEYQDIKKLANVKSVIENDLLLDTSFYLSDNENLWLNSQFLDLELYHEGDLDLGRMPESDNEIIIKGSKDDYYIGDNGKDILDKEVYLQNNYTGELNKDLPLKIVGIKYEENANYYSIQTAYANKKIMTKISFQNNEQYSKMKVLFEDKYYTSSYNNPYFKIIKNNNVPSGSVYVSEDLNYSCPKEKCLGEPLKIEVSNLYYYDSAYLTVKNIYNNKNIKSLLGIDDYDNVNGAIFISEEDYNKLFNKDNYQSSVFVSNVNDIDKTATSLEEMGYKTLKIKDTLVSDGTTQMIRILKTVVIVILVITLFFISYFVIRIILKSRNVYFSIIRMLGATKKISKQLLVIELFTVYNIAYFSFMIFLLLGKFNIINVNFVSTILTYLKFNDYVLLYLILLGMSYLISQKFAKKLFKNSATSTLKEEV